MTEKEREELIEGLEAIESLALEIKNRHAAYAIGVRAQDLIKKLKQDD